MSEFANILKRVLEETELFTLAEWSQLLGVRLQKLESWLSDTEIPAAYNLNMMYITLENSSNIPEAPLVAFKEMINKRATLVSPHGARMLPTVYEYMKRPVFDELSSALAKLDHASQTKLLLARFPEEH